MALDKVKLEHKGAKKGKGAWCRKVDAKTASKKHRRNEDKEEIEKGKTKEGFET